MKASNFLNYLYDLYGQFDYEVTYTKHEVYKGYKYIIKVNDIQIGVYTVYDDDIGGSEYYEECIAGHKIDFVALIFSDPSNIYNQSVKGKIRLDYNTKIPFP